MRLRGRGNELSIAAITDLFFGCSPSAIVWLVIAVVVLAINAVERAPILGLAGWPRPHVSEESPERAAPAIANLDAARSVAVIAGVVRVVTAGKRLLPRFVFWSCASVFAMSLAVSCYSFTRRLASQAAAASGEAACQRISADDLFVFAIAAAQPCGVTAFSALSKGGDTNDNQAAEA